MITTIKFEKIYRHQFTHEKKTHNEKLISKTEITGVYVVVLMCMLVVEIYMHVLLLGNIG